MFFFLEKLDPFNKLVPVNNVPLFILKNFQEELLAYAITCSTKIGCGSVCEKL